MLTLPNQQIVKGIIFDLNGTMVDDMMIHHRAWRQTLANLGLTMTLEEVKEKVHGVNEEIIARLFPGRFSRDQIKKIAYAKESEYRQIFRPDLRLLDGLAELIGHLNEMSIPKGIGTAAPKENLDFVLDGLNLREVFPVSFHSGDVNKGKPDPEVFQKVADGIGVPVEECLIFEDSPTGAEAARRAGATVIIITTTHNEEEFRQFPNVIHMAPDFTDMTIEKKDGQWALKIIEKIDTEEE